MVILLEVGNLLPVIIIGYLAMHLPAFILLAIAYAIRDSKPKASKVLNIIAVVYFVVGAGVCGSMLVG